MLKSKTILFVLPSHLGIRDFIYSPFLEQNFAAENIRVVFVLENAFDHKKYFEKDSEIIFEEFVYEENTLYEKIKNKIVKAIYGTLNYRFSKIKNLKHIAVKENIPKEYIVDGEDVLRFWIKFPLPNSKILYKLFYNIYNSSLFSQAHAKLLINKYSPDLVVLGSAQTPAVRSYCIEATKKNVKILGYTSNWDSLTTRGPTFKNIAEFIVWNKQMVDELRYVHEVKKPIHPIGLLHTDYSFNSMYVWNKDMLCKKIGLPANKKIIVFGVYHERFGRHEPSIALHLAKNILDKHNAHLIIRGYPKDGAFFARYKELEGFKNVTLTIGHRFSSPQSKNKDDDRLILNSLMKNLDILISSGTTLDLEALRFEKPVINIGFDGDYKLPKLASIASRYEVDHHQKFFPYKSTYFVKSYGELDRVIAHALDEPYALDDNIKKMKVQYLEPLDGKASERLFEIIKSK